MGNQGVMSAMMRGGGGSDWNLLANSLQQINESTNKRRVEKAGRELISSWASSGGKIKPEDLQKIAEESNVPAQVMLKMVQALSTVTQGMDAPTLKEKFELEKRKADLVQQKNLFGLAEKPGIPITGNMAGLFREAGIEPQVEHGATGQALLPPALKSPATGLTQEKNWQPGPTVRASGNLSSLRRGGWPEEDRFFTAGTPKAPTLPSSEVGLFAQRGSPALKEYLGTKAEYGSGEKPYYTEFNNNLVEIKNGKKRIIEKGSIEGRAVSNAMHDPSWQYADETEQAGLIEKHKRFLTGETNSSATTKIPPGAKTATNPQTGEKAWQDSSGSWHVIKK